MKPSEYNAAIKKRGRWFPYCLDYLEILSFQNATVLAFLCNRAMVKEREGKITEEGWFRCSSSMLQHTMKFTARQEKQCLRNLERAGYIQRRMKGLPAKRQIKVAFSKIHKDLEASYQTADGDW